MVFGIFALGKRHQTYPLSTLDLKKRKLRGLNVKSYIQKVHRKYSYDHTDIDFKWENKLTVKKLSKIKIYFTA